MRIYVALYDMDLRFLVGKKREWNQWRKGAYKPLKRIVDEPGTYCFPSGEQDITETHSEAARRVYADLTGQPLPNGAMELKTVFGPDWTLVCYTVGSLKRICEQVNAGLQPSFNGSPEPVNKKVVDWELEKVEFYPRAELDRVLGCRAPAKGEYVDSPARPHSMRQYKVLLALVDTLL